ncbi:MAG: carbamoyltransferase C-terminal domain-containing protein, partial [Candidatus Omnitrophota bacterium]|nr:carbamoyltransferase C-terminal domain-containing protein [Candidatus Omnitrophota bacterium]
HITVLLSEAKEGRIRKIKEFYSPHSLGLFYSTVTEYLGFESHDGEYKTMGMAPYGDPNKIDLSFMIRPTASAFKVNNEHVWVIEPKRYRPDRMYSRAFIERFGPPRQGDGLTEPYIHIAAAAQKALEDITIHLMETYLADSLKRHKTLCLAGGCALNVTMNRKLLMHPLVERIYVPPAAHDAGTPLGAAALVADALGERMAPMTSAYYGPAFDPDAVKAVLDRAGVSYHACDNAIEEASDLLARGEIVGWFQGRMEFGPRALGNRSILAHPSIKGTRDKINAIVKFREGWRPFCPSVLQEQATEIFEAKQDSPFMTLSFMVRDRWRSRIPEVVHVDGSARPQTVDQRTNPRVYALLQQFYQKTGLPLVLNTSLNRRGEPIVCSPEDALTMFAGCGLQHLFLEDFLVSKRDGVSRVEQAQDLASACRKR